MSKTRAQARAEREAAAARAAEQARIQRGKQTAAQARRDRRVMFWRHNRLWRHGPSFQRNKETWAALATLVMMLLLGAYFLTRSLGAVLLVAHVLLIASPALVKLFFDRSRR